MCGKLNGMARKVHSRRKQSVAPFTARAGPLYLQFPNLQQPALVASVYALDIRALVLPTHCLQTGPCLHHTRWGHIASAEMRLSSASACVAETPAPPQRANVTAAPGCTSVPPHYRDMAQTTYCRGQYELKLSSRLL